LEEDAKAECDAQLPNYQRKKAAYDEKAKNRQQRGTAPKPPNDFPLLKVRLTVHCRQSVIILLS
jgi:hypothetical protein